MTKMAILDGKEVAKSITQRVKEEVEQIRQRGDRVPGLTVVIVGENPASQIYVGMKNKKAANLGYHSNMIALPENTPEEKIIATIKELNTDDKVDAILVQLPLPSHFNTWKILDHLAPEKDVDRFHPTNQGMIVLNREKVFPCTPSGILQILDYYKIDVTGMNAVVVGRSFIVGKPIAAMLTNRHATVTICHSRTKNLAGITRQADIIVAATGMTGLISEDMIKEGAILIDVGQNTLEKEEDVLRYCNEKEQKKFPKKGYGITGDIDIRAFEKASHYTPVPGGIGPMTVAMLMENTLELYKNRIGDL